MNTQRIVYDTNLTIVSRLIRSFGTGLILLGIVGLIITVIPFVKSEMNYRLNNQETPSGFGLLIAQAQAQEQEYTKTLASQFGVSNTNFSLYIPKINAKADIIENVDTLNPQNYQDALSRGIAHAAGSVFPGIDGATFLFAHSTDSSWNVARYNAVFYLLRELDPKNNDEIYVFFLGKVYKYKVSAKYIVGANDVSWLAQAQEGSERLILQTCWPPGTTWKRLIVVAIPDNQNSY